MAAGIASWVKSLGDFPLDPDRGQSWLWTGDGARLLWMSDAAGEALAFAPGRRLDDVSHGQSLESFAVELGNMQPDRQPIRVKQVPLSLGRHSDMFTCLCRHVPLVDGSGFGLLTVAIGAPPRLAGVRTASVGTPPADSGAQQPGDDKADEHHGPQDAALPHGGAVQPSAAADERPAGGLSVEAPSPVVAPLPEAPLPEAPPAWLAVAAEHRRPLRFVWQTDADGRFVHLSRELAEAVGPGSAMILGQRFADVAQALDLREAEGVTAALGARDTWTAGAVLWPAAGADMGVPVELAGMPVRENGAFAGFRGYGIARIERAVKRQGSAAAALAADRREIKDAREERFGPAVAEVLGIVPAEDAAGSTASPALKAAKPAATPPAATAGTPALSATPPQPAQIELPMAPPPGPPAEDRSSLSPSERSAFREIARALGKPETDEPHPTPEADATPPASPRQMPAWIARRQQLRQDARQEVRQEALQETRQEDVEPTRDMLAPVVPYEAFQARLDRRGREPLQGAASAIVEKLPMAVLVMQSGKPVFANASFLELSDHKDFASFAAAGGFDQFFPVQSPGGEPRPSAPFNVRDRRGRTIPVDAQVQAIVWDDAPASLMTFRPVAASNGPAAPPAESRALELELSAARAELRELRFVLDTATDGVLSLDASGRILAANRSAEALFGFDQKEITGELFTVLLEPESHAAALDYLEGLRSDGVATIMNDGREVAGRERHGGRIPLFMTLGRMGAAQPDVRFCAVLRDVTIWKKAEAELTDARQAAEDSNANKTDFLARVSHEIRTPMNAIIGFADVMRNETFGPLGNEKYKGYINDIHASGEHVVSLVNDLLDLSKVAAGKLDLTFGSVDINQAVAASVSMIQPQANAGRVIVRTQLSPVLPPVVADDRSVRQIVLNLLSNAAKFTEPGGQVVVTTTLTERGEAAIRVRDTGIGMSAEELKRAIEPFRQISGPKSSGGTGLGLPLTKALTEANRASFSITSEPGKGTLAEVVFPSTRVLAE